MSGTINVKNEDYYIGCCRCYEIKYHDGKVATPDNTVGWFGESEGYASVQTNKLQAMRFPTAFAVREAVKYQDGMPWMYRFKPGTLTVIRVTRRTTIKCVETEVLITT